MTAQPQPLNGDFGALLDGVGPDDLADAAFRACARDLWHERGGLLAVRGAALADISPQTLMDWAGNFGVVEAVGQAGRAKMMVPGYPILRIGNQRDADGNPTTVFAKVPPIQRDEDVRYNPETKRPVWHTDSTFRENPPIGSARPSLERVLGFSASSAPRLSSVAEVRSNRQRSVSLAISSVSRSIQPAALT